MKILLLVVTIIILLSLWSRILIVSSSKEYISTVDAVRAAPVAIVFGAGLKHDGSPTLVLQDRIETAVALYQAGKVQKILMSGDNRTLFYNEPGAMRAYAISAGVPEEDIVLDYAGQSTYDTCYRAKEIFGLSDVLLVTQEFHLSRAVYTCRALGLNAEGVIANIKLFRRSSLLYWSLRELPAALNALIEVHITHPLPVLGEKEPVFPVK